MFRIPPERHFIRTELAPLLFACARAIGAGQAQNNPPPQGKTDAPPRLAARDGMEPKKPFESQLEFESSSDWGQWARQVSSSSARPPSQKCSLSLSRFVCAVRFGTAKTHEVSGAERRRYVQF